MESVKDNLENICGALLRSNLVCGLSPDEIRDIAALGHYVNYAANDHLIIHNHTDADLYVIEQGTIRIVTDDGDVLNEVGPGGIVGEIAFVDAGPRHAFVVAQTWVKVVKFPAVDLRRHLCHHKDAGFLVLTNIARLLAARLRSADGRIDKLMDHEHDIWRHEPLR